jgi:hypothetical protein
MKDKLLPLSIAILGVGVVLLLGACGPGETPTPQVIKETVEVEVPVTVTPQAGAVQEIPFEEMWASSAHADAEAEAFTHWDEDDPPVVPTSCAKCHSQPGYLDFLGLDGTGSGVVDNDAPTGTVVSCVTCHNEGTLNMTSVVMPSGVEITGLGDEARCMQCHQGRESTISVNAALEEAGIDEDTTSEELGFLNIHYYAAAATKYGTVAKGGFQYEGKSYDARFDHVESYQTCVDCHNPHTLEVRVSECAVCHSGVESAEDLREVRMQGSLVDFDGDGDLEEGIFDEIGGLQDLLLQAIQIYGSEVAGAPIAYDAHAYPYFFIDTDEDGEAGEEEANYGNRYIVWTPRLVKAAYNYQVSQKDPGGYAHGGKYIIQLLYDSIEDLNTALSSPVDLSGAHRIDHGHFAGSEEAFRHWDEDGEVAGSCSRCHSAAGLPLYLAEGVEIAQPTANGFECATCHDSLTEFTRFQVEQVSFPSGSTLGFENADANLCLNCHQGRSSTGSVDRSIGDKPVDEVSDELRFINIHYFAAGATLFGSEAEGAYQYEGKEYLGQFQHIENFNTCVDCHEAHQLEVKVQACSGCHPSVTDLETLTTIRGPNSTEDYDGDGDVEEGIAGEIETIHAALYTAIQAYAAQTGGADAIVYDAHSYPYFFIDTDGDGEAGPGEAIYPNQYATWTPRLLRAAYNYQYASKDPGAFAHNGKYVLQVLYDTLEDIGGDVGGMIRP